MKQLHRVLIFLLPLLLAGCKHTLEIDGRGDIVEILNGVRGCSLDEFSAGLSTCTDNDVFTDERVVYRGLPRPGWRFSHWDGVCAEDSPGDDCELRYKEAAARAWDEQHPDKDLPPLTAVFVQEGDTLAGQEYIAASFGAEGRTSYGSLLDGLFTTAGDYRYTTLQASSRDSYDRRIYNYQRQKDGLLGTSPDGGTLVSGGAATGGMDFLTLVDTDNSDSDISVAYLMPRQSDADAGSFQGTYYCGHIGSRAPGYARFFRAVMDGKGRGALSLISDRWGQNGSAGMSYAVAGDGTTTLDYLGLRLVGSLSADGSVFTGAEMADSGKGAGICIRASAYKTLGTLQGSYYGAWMNLQPV